MKAEEHRKHMQELTEESANKPMTRGFVFCALIGIWSTLVDVLQKMEEKTPCPKE